MSLLVLSATQTWKANRKTGSPGIFNPKFVGEGEQWTRRDSHLQFCREGTHQGLFLQTSAQTYTPCLPWGVHTSETVLTNPADPAVLCAKITCSICSNLIVPQVAAHRHAKYSPKCIILAGQNQSPSSSNAFRSCRNPSLQTWGYKLPTETGSTPLPLNHSRPHKVLDLYKQVLSLKYIQNATH